MLGVVIMPEEKALQFESEAEDTVAYYVKQNVTVRGFFCRTGQNRRESTFSIQPANPDIPANRSETRQHVAPRFIFADVTHRQMDLFEISPSHPHTPALGPKCR